MADAVVNNSNISLDIFYPVGSIYMSINDTSPELFMGGGWKKVSEGRALFGAGTLNGNTYTANTTIDAGLPNIEGSFYGRPHGSANGINGGGITGAQGAFKFTINGTTQSDNGCNETGTMSNSDLITFNASKSNSIYGNSTTVQPNAFVVNIWVRIS